MDCKYENMCKSENVWIANENGTMFYKLFNSQFVLIKGENDKFTKKRCMNTGGDFTNLQLYSYLL